MNPVKLAIQKPVSDWYEIVPYELNPRAYTWYALCATELVWTLECYNKKAGEDVLMETFTLAPGSNIATLVSKLNVMEIKANKYCSIRELLK